MAVSNEEICNNALTKLGALPITSLSDANETARRCNRIFTIMRDNLLRAHPWNFAVQRSALAQLTATPAFGYNYQYQLPSDCLRVLRLNDTEAEYRIEGQRLLTSASSVKLIYIKKVTDPTQFDSSFSDLLARKMAAELAYAFIPNVQLSSSLNDQFERQFRRAKMIDAQEDSIYTLESTTYDRSRLTET